MQIHIHLHSENNPKLDELLELTKQRGNEMAELLQAFADLKAKVANQITVDNSIEALVQGLKTQLDALAQQETIDPADVQALADTLAAEQVNIQNAVTAGTVAAPPGAAVPTEAARTVQKPNANIPPAEITNVDPNAPENTPTTVPDTSTGLSSETSTEPGTELGTEPDPSSPPPTS